MNDNVINGIGDASRASVGDFEIIGRCGGLLLLKLRAYSWLTTPRNVEARRYRAYSAISAFMLGNFFNTVLLQSWRFHIAGNVVTSRRNADIDISQMVFERLSATAARIENAMPKLARQC